MRRLAITLVVLASTSPAPRSGDPRQVKDDREHRGERGDRSQYRLRMETDLNLDGNLDGVQIGRDELALEIVYLVP